MNSEILLLKTKICVPPARSDFVRRPRLTGRINLSVKGPLTLLSAPAGFGKTQLLIEWASAIPSPIAWFTLDYEDNDLPRFFRYFINVFQGIEPQLGDGIFDYLQSTELSRLEIGLTLLINQISAFPQDIVLVLDDYHVLENVILIAGLNFLLKHLPSNLHLLIASRSEVSLDLAPLRAKGQVTELGADDLRLTTDEIKQFFSHTMSLQLAPATIQALEQRTEGWIVGLQLAALSLQNRASPVDVLKGFHGDAHYMVEFLAQEVLNRQPEEVRQFLLRNAILDVLSGPLCEAVLGLDGESGFGTRMLDRLEHLNLFLTPLDQQHQWFRFHNLFADFLRHILTDTNASEIPVLHQRAAIWFEQYGDLDQAFKHGLASGDFDWVADLMERNLEAMVKIGDNSTFTHWIGKLPRDLIHQRPRIGIAYAWGLIASHQFDEAKYWTNHFRQMFDGEHQLKGEAQLDSGESAELRRHLVRLAILRSILAMYSGDLKEAAESLSSAPDYVEEEEIPFVQSMLLLEESMYYILQGDTSKAIVVLRETIKFARLASAKPEQVVGKGGIG